MKETKNSQNKTSSKQNPPSAIEWGRLYVEAMKKIVPKKPKSGAVDRESLIREAFKGKIAGDVPNIGLTGGLPGAGKTSAIRALGIDKSLYVLADADDVKARAGFTNSNEHHEIASAINKEIARRAIEGNYHLIYDSLLTNYGLADDMISKVLEKGGDAHIAFTNIDAYTSQARSRARVEKGELSRTVPLEASIKGHNFALPTFIQLYKKYKDNPSVSFRLFDNNTDFSPVKIVFRHENGVTEVVNKELFDNLMKTEYHEVKGARKYERDEKLTKQDLIKAEAAISDRVGSLVRGSDEKDRAASTRTEKEVKEPLPAPKPTYGANNKLVSQERAEELKKHLREKLDQLNAGVDPETHSLGTEFAVYHIEAGSRSFIKFSRAIVNELGEKAKPYLKSWYMGARYFPGMSTEGMNTAAEIDAIDVDDLFPEVESSPKEAEAPEKAISSYEEFKETYERLFSEMSRYTDDQVGSSHFAEQMAELADNYPEWMARYDEESEQAYIGQGKTGEATGDPLSAYGLTIKKATTKNGNTVWELSGDTRPWKDAIKKAGGKWYGPRKVWSFYGEVDPTEKIMAQLPDNPHPSLALTAGKEGAEAPEAFETLAEWVAQRLARRTAISWQELYKEADKAFGGTQAQGAYTPKDAYPCDTNFSPR